MGIFKYLPFIKNKTEVEKNREKLIGICKYLLNCPLITQKGTEIKSILDLNILRIDLGYLNTRLHDKLSIQFTLKNGYIRFNYKISNEFKILEFVGYYEYIDGKMNLKSSDNNPLHKSKIDKLNNIKNYIHSYFKDHNLLDSNYN